MKTLLTINKVAKMTSIPSVEPYFSGSMAEKIKKEKMLEQYFMLKLIDFYGIFLRLNDIHGNIESYFMCFIN